MHYLSMSCRVSRRSDGMKGDVPALLGRDRLAHICLDWLYLTYQLQSTLSLEELLQGVP